jgi:hypothetical protein
MAPSEHSPEIEAILENLPEVTHSEEVELLLREASCLDSACVLAFA